MMRDLMKYWRKYAKWQNVAARLSDGQIPTRRGGHPVPANPLLRLQEFFTRMNQIAAQKHSNRQDRFSLK